MMSVATDGIVFIARETSNDIIVVFYTGWEKGKIKKEMRAERRWQTEPILDT